ncbi:hypothetical protein LZK98_13000 [Sphingomonas cannabina]|uniref:hypothetical protein n=1 Tax=Sphingomonas cannabina TaxID=2899123 RepID=UPI001F40CAE8|nr:hypothetical protein [Sphingomonas cannabina]UIJ43996.1 hypothetical protein LZK98_13000 [Sphingomonas cannabina]
MDRILFGDNQFFGINHMSEEKARQQAIAFRDVSAIVDTLRAAHKAGIDVFMCTTHDRVAEVADIVRANRGDWQGMKFYPCMPYAHKYANAVTELGYVDALRKFMPSGNMLDAAMRGGKALLTRDVRSAATLLIDAEMKPFEGLETPIVFLQNVVTDLLLGLGFFEAFRIFADHVERRYGAEAGFITMNLPALLPALESVGIRNPIVCANVNKIGFRMSGGIPAYRDALASRPARVIAMSVLASGAIPASEAIEWVVNEPYVQSILFGASSERNIRNTVELIRRFDGESVMA